MKVYIAAPYPMIDYAKRIMRMLERHGVDVTSTWLKGGCGEEDNNEAASIDLADVAAADVLLALNPEGWESKGTGGRHVEFGYAVALRKHIILVGERSNVFHHLSSIKVIDDTEDVVKYVLRLA